MEENKNQETKKEGIYIPVEQVELPIDHEEKKENSYLRHISSDYFEADRKRILNQKELSEDDRLYEAFLNEAQKKIETITHLSKESIEKDEQKLWKEIAPALSELMQRMTNNKSELLYNPNTQLSDVNKHFEDYETAKKIFMSVCNKFYSEEKINIDASTYCLEIERLKKLTMPGGSLNRESTSEIRGLLQEENPRKMIERIDTNQHFFADQTRTSAFIGFEHKLGNEEIQEGTLKDQINGISNSVYSLYRLELMRDELAKKNYGTSAKLIDQKKVDDIRKSM